MHSLWPSSQATNQASVIPAEESFFFVFVSIEFSSPTPRPSEWSRRQPARRCTSHRRTFVSLLNLYGGTEWFRFDTRERTTAIPSSGPSTEPVTRDATLIPALFLSRISDGNRPNVQSIAASIDRNRQQQQQQQNQQNQQKFFKSFDGRDVLISSTILGWFSFFCQKHQRPYSFSLAILF